MEIVLAIVLFIAVCAALMLWDYYKPARFRTTYRNVDTDRRWTGDYVPRSHGDDESGSDGSD